MYEYQYITVNIGGGVWYNNTEKRHQSVIDAQAEKGWRYVGHVPVDFNHKGAPISIDLIFERQVD